MSAPAATSTRIQPLVALAALLKLQRNPEDTHQVFMIGEALRGKSLARATARFRATPLGAKVLNGEYALLPWLSDRATLATLPAGSLGRVYLDFVVAENLSAEGLVEAARKRDEVSTATPDQQALRRHIRDSHDLWHVLSGYGRDPLGEVCLLAFTHAQTSFTGLGAIALLGCVRIARVLRGLPVRQAVLQGRRAGRTAAWLPAVEMAALLPQDLNTVRRELGIAAPDVYRQIGHRLQSSPALAAAARAKFARPTTAENAGV